MNKPITLPDLLEMHANGEKIAMLTCYDASFAVLLDHCGVDVLLVGDSLGMVLQGQAATLSVTLEQMVYHVQSVARGLHNVGGRAWVIGDLPSGSYAASPVQAYESACRLIAAGAQMIKIEGGAWLAETIHFLSERGIPICGHLGLIPQSIHQLGGYRVQGKTDSAAQQLKRDAQIVQDAGAHMLVLEMIPARLSGEIATTVKIPTIGIGASPQCSGQVLVLHDMLNIYPGKKARFVRNFMQGAGSIEAALRAYVAAVKDGSYPQAEHTY